MPRFRRLAPLVAIPVLKTIYYRSAQEMKIQAETSVIASNSFIELLALKCEADGMLAENHFRQTISRDVAYTEIDF